MALGQSQTTSARTAGKLDSLWELERNSPLAVSDNLLDLMKDKHVVFVPGIMNEVAYWVTGYYSTFSQAIQGIFGTTPSYVGLKSSNPIEKNVPLLYDKLLRIHRQQKKPLVLLAHSKGGAEVLLTLMNHPSLILEGIVDRAILIQAAIGGCNLLSQEDSNAPMYSKILKRSAFLILRDGLNSLKPEAARSLFDHAYENLVNNYSEDEKNLISKRISYVRSYRKKEKMSWGTYFVLLGLPKDLDTHSILHDGLLTLDAQAYPNIGSNLGEIQADHMDIAVDGWASGKGKEDKEAFIRALFRALYEPESINSLLEETAVPTL